MRSGEEELRVLLTSRGKDLHVRRRTSGAHSAIPSRASAFVVSRHAYCPTSHIAQDLDFGCFISSMR